MRTVLKTARKYFEKGQYASAEKLLLKTLKRNSGATEVRYSLGLVYSAQTRFDEALACFEAVLESYPEHVDTLCNAANVYKLKGNAERAMQYYQTALRNDPQSFLACSSLASTLYEQGILDEAARYFRDASRIRPDLAETYLYLGSVLWELQNEEEAIRWFVHAAQLRPDLAAAHYNLGGALLQQGHADEAIAHLKTALELKPDSWETYQQLGDAYYEQGIIKSATNCYRRVAELSSSDGAKIRLLSAIPMIPASVGHIDEIRSVMSRQIDELLGADLAVRDPIKENGRPNFFLAYHGKCNKDLQEKYAELYVCACPGLEFTAPHCQDYARRPAGKKIRVGIISKFLQDHSIGNTTKGFLSELDRERFTVVVFFLGSPRDETGRFIESHADESVVLPNDLPAARKLIADKELDILFYQDVGMEPFTYFLAFARLAPVQCTSFGHPDTSGIPNLDYFVSADNYETECSDDHYSEKLFRLKDIASCSFYSKPSLPVELKSRAYFGLEEDSNIYICPQTLFKCHPDFDELLAGILRRDMKGVLVLIHGKYPVWAEILLARFRESMPDIIDRVRFLPHQKGLDFINLIAVSDVMLDTIHFCGQNTSHAGFAAGVPIVTLPGELHRSRHTLSFYRQMGVLDCVARDEEDYIDISVQLGTDPVYRADVQRRIIERRDVIWSEIRVVREFERFFEESVGEARINVIQAQGT